MQLIQYGLALLEGIALVISPCILPVLPLIFSTSIDSGRKRPFGIIVGFIIAFSLFALFSRWVVGTLGLDLDYLKYGSLFLLAGLGIIMLSKTLSDKFGNLTQGLANLGQKYTNNGGGFVSGLMIGASIGLVWTPCAGPILAAVLVQIIRGKNNLEGLFTLLAFAIGAGLPMLLIAIAGRAAVQSLTFFKKHSEGLRKILGVLLLLSVIFIALDGDKKIFFSSKKVALKNNPAGLIDALSIPYSAPEFSNITLWLNSPQLKIADLKGKVVLIDFWTYSCINCIRTLPYVTSWDSNYRKKGLVVVGVHSPEFEFEKKIENVKKALIRENIHYPVAIDNNLTTWTNFHNLYWPAHYLINQQGQVVYEHFGEGDYDVTEHNIQVLLGASSVTHKAAMPVTTLSREKTPETYLGYGRSERFINEDDQYNNATHFFTFPTLILMNNWALDGNWIVEEEKISSAAGGASIRLNFNAKKVFLVLGAANDKPIQVSIKLNGKPAGENVGKDAPGGKITVSEHRLYELIDQKQLQNGLLEIKTLEPGLEAYAFTFE